MPTLTLTLDDGTTHEVVRLTSRPDGDLTAIDAEHGYEWVVDPREIDEVTA